MVLACYDISDEEVRSRLSKSLERYGTRVQESVFECRLTTRMLTELQASIRRAVGDVESLRGSIRTYHLCPRCARSIQTMGDSSATSRPGESSLIV